MALTDFDRALIAATQGGLPLVARPYEAVGAMLGVSGEQVRQRLSERRQARQESAYVPLAPVTDVAPLAEV